MNYEKKYKKYKFKYNNSIGGVNALDSLITNIDIKDIENNINLLYNYAKDNYNISIDKKSLTTYYRNITTNKVNLSYDLNKVNEEIISKLSECNRLLKEPLPYLIEIKAILIDIHNKIKKVDKSKTTLSGKRMSNIRQSLVSRNIPVPMVSGGNPVLTLNDTFPFFIFFLFLYYLVNHT